MASTSKSSAPISKLCPRCGAFYQDLPSKTCPQCFAVLEPLSDEHAQIFIEEQERRVRDPEFLKEKAEQDEQFKEQSFGACMAVVLIVLATVIICVVVIVVGARHYNRQNSGTPQSMPAILQSVPPANFDAILPVQVANAIRTSADTDQKIPGVNIAIFHANYSDGTQVFALPSLSATDSNISTLRLAVSFAANQHDPPFSEKEESTPKAHYIVIGPQVGAVHALADALDRK